MKRLAYLFPAFPLLHQTFTVGEVLGLQRRGYDLCLISLRPHKGGLQQPEALPLVSQTHYCPPVLSWPVLSATFRALVAHPLRALSLPAFVYGAWKDPRSEGSRSAVRPAASTMGIRERLDMFLKTNSVLYLLKSLWLIPYAFYLSEYLRREGIGHVHAHWATYSTTVALLMAEWCGISYSFSAHAYDIYVIRRMLPAKIRNAAFVVTCAETNRQFLSGLVSCGQDAGKIHVNYHGTDLKKFPVAEREAGGPCRIVSCGNLEEYKGLHYLIDALALLVRRGVDAVCEIAGNGPQLTLLRKRTRELGVADRVTFHGYVDHVRLVELYRKASVFALPSIVMGNCGKHDVIPNVLVEAMAVGLPVVGTNLSGIPELVEHGVTGLLVEQRNAEALASALEKIHSDPETSRRYARAARDKIERMWDRESNLVELGALIDSYLAEDSEIRA
ncbi:MAG: glycosyltransferase [Candidatus Binatia bacterium]